MNKTKKLLSALTAAAISVSAFAGFATTAGAAEPTAKTTVDFEDDVNPFSATAGSMHLFTDNASTNPLTTGKVMYVDRNRTAYWDMPTDYTGNTKVSFDLKIDAIGGGYDAYFALSDNVSRKDTANIEGNTDILYISQHATGNGQASKLLINGVDIAQESNNAAYNNVIVNGYQRSSPSDLVDANNRQSTGWLHYDAIINFTTETINLKVTRIADNTSVYSNSALPFYVKTDTEANTTAAEKFGAIYFSATPTNKSTYGQVYVDNILAQDAPVAQSVVIDGDTEITKGASNTYKVIITDQYGDVSESDSVIAIKDEATGVSIENNVLSVTNDTEATSVTLTVTVDGVVKEQTINITSEKGHILTTTPYSLITVDSDEPVNSGKSGVVELAKKYGDGNNHTVKITKPGYTEYNESISLAKDGSSEHKLTCTKGDYYEDFSNVTDDFGFESGTKVSGGILTTGSAEESTSAPETPDLSGKLFTINVMQDRDDRTRHLYLNQGDGNIDLNFRTTAVQINGQGNGKGPVVSAGNYHDVSVYVPSEASERMMLYVDGLKSNENAALVSSLSSTKINTYAINAESTKKLYIKEITIGDKPDDVVVKIGDSTSTYLSGTAYTLPEAETKEGYTFLGWSDGTNLYDAGKEFTATANVTYTAQYGLTADGAATILSTVGLDDEGNELDAEALNEIATSNYGTADYEAKLATPVYAEFVVPASTKYEEPAVTWNVSYNDGAGKTTRQKTTYPKAEAIEGDGTTKTSFGAVFTGVDLNRLNASITAALTGTVTTTE